MSSRDQDFSEQMQFLAAQAEQHFDPKQAEKPAADLPEALRPLVLGLQALSRATAENTLLLSKLEAAAIQQESLPYLMGSIQETLDKKNAINQQLFDSLYEELKGYKDGFLLEVMHKPLVLDLITLFDDLSRIQAQFEVLSGDELAGAGDSSRVLDYCKNVGTNLHHMIGSLIEVMARMEVAPMKQGRGKLDKQIQRAIAIEPADAPEEDRDVVRTLKQGFLWRDRVFRPEEVVIKKWSEGDLVALPSQK